MLGTPTFETNRVCLCISQAKQEQLDKPEFTDYTKCITLKG